MTSSQVERRPAPPSVRRAAAGDFDEWFALFEGVAAEGRWLGTELPVDPESRRAFFERAVVGEESVIFLADAPGGGPLVGMLSVSLSHGGLADLGMCVAAGERGAGVGTALMEAALGWARERGAHKVILEVWPHNHAARSLYSKFGFVTEGRKRRHWRRRNGHLWDGVLMGLVLDETTPGGPDDGDHVRVAAPIAFPADGLSAPAGVVVRPWGGTDVSALIAAMADHGVRAWLGADDEGSISMAAEAWTASGRRASAEGTGLRLALVSEGRLAGCLNLHVDPHDPATGGLGYLVFAEARGRGVASGAVATITEWAFGPGGMRRLEIKTAVDNTAARGVAERAGFELEGVRRAWRVVDAKPHDFASYARVAPT